MHLDYRLSKILSDTRIERSRSIRGRKLRERSDLPNQQGLSPIVRVENPPGDRPKAA
jgi:hypothetical protein